MDMAESHVVSGLANKRAKIAGMIARSTIPSFFMSHFNAVAWRAQRSPVCPHPVAQLARPAGVVTWQAHQQQGESRRIEACQPEVMCQLQMRGVMSFIASRRAKPLNEYPRPWISGSFTEGTFHLHDLTHLVSCPSSTVFADCLPRHTLPPFSGRAAFTALVVSGRRRRARLLSRWPPSAAQTVHAVFPHTAFTKTQLSEWR